MTDPKFTIPVEIIDLTVEAISDHARRLEIEAAALAGLASPGARKLAQERLEQADHSNKLTSFFASLGGEGGCNG